MELKIGVKSLLYNELLLDLLQSENQVTDYLKGFIACANIINKKSMKKPLYYKKPVKT